MKEQIIQFYAGKLPQAADWLLANNVDYIVWNARDARESPAWEQIKTSIEQHYAWHEFQAAGNGHIGLWVRRRGG
ncbi:MAG: hypothetical protein NTV00_10355 [Methylococcales bacterium]|nr:hypothetical protein [Methylococcales bacterium]